MPGHLEGDLLLGGGHSQIATLVERQPLRDAGAPSPRPSTDHVVDELAAHVITLPDQLRRSLTWDRRHDMTDHLRFSVATGVDVYFCDPKTPWRRGSNENTNGLLRQYFPKRTTLAGYTQADLDLIAERLNKRRLRKTLDWMSPSERLAELLR